MLNYNDMCLRDTFLGRFRYLSLDGEVGVDTFGNDRYINQTFYTSFEWKRIRDVVIIRDNGCDLGIPGMEIHDKILVHHMNPINKKDILHFNDDILNPDYLISVSLKTHNAIHYGELPSNRLPLERKPGDTKLW